MLRKSYLSKLMFLLPALAGLYFQSNAQTAKTPATLQRPKLVVGLVIDQMRWDYLYRYYDRYQSGGFKRLLNEGFSCNQVYITHLPAETAVGHSTLYTGSVPAIHGITGNNWKDEVTGKNWYCTDDSLEQTVGSNSRAGRMSPRNLLASTITDELALATNFRSRIVGVSLKDRASILPAGHKPTAVFWLDNESENFISSTYYMKALPQWLQNFNRQQHGRKMISKGWNTLYPLNTYLQSSPDNVAWEETFAGESKPTFPHDVNTYYQSNPDIIRKTPYGNTLTLELSKAAIEGYNLGAGAATDFLAINCASTDYVGHMYGPNSVEVEDTYLRLDKDLADFFSYLDKKIGRGNYSLFLTADHGGAHNISFLQSHHLAGDFLKTKNILTNLNAHLERSFKLHTMVTGSSSTFLSFNVAAIKKAGLNYNEVKEEAMDFLRKQPGIQFTADMQNLHKTSIPKDIMEKLVNAYNSKRCGDVAIVPEPGWFNGREKGTGHSLWNPFDTHIPMVFMGWGIKKGHSEKAHSMNDLAPTLAALLKIQVPNGSVGRVMEEVLVH